MGQLETFVAAEHGRSLLWAGLYKRRRQHSGCKKLEEDLGLKLFDRSGRNPALTSTGERLLLEAKVTLGPSRAPDQCRQPQMFQTPSIRNFNSANAE
ncbi:LysR family transcriptional regulator [Rhizobium sullae]|uniref:LysR family transcriptional regulator n=1 Tax=Rhizobium sullae TaxID=50338 RepID=A0A2N0DAI5_RHISU|nr:LysR family transcriptional regulator [Rhizobium sullae]